MYILLFCIFLLLFIFYKICDYYYFCYFPVGSRRWGRRPGGGGPPGGQVLEGHDQEVLARLLTWKQTNKQTKNKEI